MLQRVMCPRPNCGRSFYRIKAVEISGCFEGLCRIVANSGETILGANIRLASANDCAWMLPIERVGAGALC